MKILAFETSCDDTSIAIFENDTLLGMSTKSQIKEHNKTGGVVPEVAARLHANSIFDALSEVLEESNIKLEEIDYIGVTTNPGLIPSLLTGITVANTIGNIYNIPVIEINHIMAHIFSNYLERKEQDITYPLICLTVSGGHNDIYIMKNMWDMEKIGTSGDDAAGECFDKVAKMMGLSYPGGPIISKLALEFSQKLSEDDKKTRKHNNLFPRVWLDKKLGNFSFSGLKSAVKREVDKRKLENKELTYDDKLEISYEFQEAVNEVLSYKLVNLAKINQVNLISLAGGVSANTDLKDKIKKLSLKENLKFISPVKLIYSMDNAAMVGILTYYKVKYNKS